MFTWRCHSAIVASRNAVFAILTHHSGECSLHPNIRREVCVAPQTMASSWCHQGRSVQFFATHHHSNQVSQ